MSNGAKTFLIALVIFAVSNMYMAKVKVEATPNYVAQVKQILKVKEAQYNARLNKLEGRIRSLETKVK